LHRRRSLSAAILATLALVTPLLFAARLVHLYVTTRERLWAELRAGTAADADEAAIALELPIWNLDRPQIARVVEIDMGAPPHQAIVVEAGGATFAMRRDPTWRPVPFDGKVDEAGLLREDRDVRFAGERIGHVTLYATPRFAEAQLRRTVLETGLIAAVIALLAAVALWVLLRQIVLAPLRQLEGYARAVTAGRRPDPSSLGVRFRGEIDTLWTSLTHMVALLDVRYAQLQDAEGSIRALLAKLHAAREDEKTRIARDLHDDLGQLLTAVQMELRWIEERLEQHPEGELVSALTDHAVEAGRLVEQTTRTVQRIAADLRPSALDQLGLAAALRQEGRRFQERTGAPCEVVVLDEIPDLDGRAAITLYRVAQEALTNVARHAAATRVMLTLGANEHDVFLRVEDDGRGLEDGDRGPGALGLVGMQERAAMLGGEVRFSPRDGGGTVVELRAPRGRVLAEERRVLA
jgi:signal transduction histidine kinase